MNRSTVRYTMRNTHFDTLWLPAAFWALFIIVLLFIDVADRRLDIARSYLGVVVPLVGGIMAAYAILDDPILELRFATPGCAPALLLERMGLVFSIQALTAVTFQLVSALLAVDLSLLGDLWSVQLAWILPTMTLMAMGCFAALLGAEPVAGAGITGLIWLIQILARGWLARNGGKYVLVFMGALMPKHPALPANRLCLLALSAALTIGAWAMLRRQERYI